MVIKATVRLPRPHPGQVEVNEQLRRFNVLECGRRWGKTRFGEAKLIDPALHGYPVAWFAPTAKFAAEPWARVKETLRPVTGHVDGVDKRISLITGKDALVDFWTLDNPDSGRGRAYKRVIVDEAAIIRHLRYSWEEVIRATLTDFEGDAFFLFTPKGHNYAHKLWLKHRTDPDKWAAWRRGTVENPYISAQEVEAARRELPEHVFRQEYLGIPADDGGNPFGLDAIRRCVAAGLSDDDPVAFGVDLAKKQDYTVICGLDSQNRVCHLDRFQMDWRQTLERVHMTVGHRKALVDSTGVGDPIVEELMRHCSSVEGYQFTSRSKQQLMEGLASTIQSDEIEFPEGWLVDELETFEYAFTPAGGVKYEAPQGMHDDGVIALALANAAHRTYVPARVMVGPERENADAMRRMTAKRDKASLARF